jgi:hypothetical protein
MARRKSNKNNKIITVIKTVKNKNKNNNNKSYKNTTQKNLLTVLPRAPRTEKVRFVNTDITTHNVCALVDPFCIHAKGARWPDGNSNGTLTIQTRNMTFYNTFADGSFITYYSPRLNFDQIGASSVTAGTFNVSGAFVGNGFTNILTYSKEYRVVTAGLIIRCTMPNATAVGTLIITRVNAFPLLSGTVISGNLLGSDVTCYTLTPGLEIPIIFRPNGTDARSFKLNDTNFSTNAIELGWEVIKIEVLGAPASAGIISIEKVYNFEISVVSAYNDVSQFITKNEIANVPLQQISDIVANQATNAVAESLSSFTDKVVRYATVHVNKFMSGTSAGKIVSKFAQMALMV